LRYRQRQFTSTSRHLQNLLFDGGNLSKIWTSYAYTIPVYSTTSTPLPNSSPIFHPKGYNSTRLFGFSCPKSIRPSSSSTVDITAHDTVRRSTNCVTSSRILFRPYSPHSSCRLSTRTSPLRAAYRNKMFWVSVWFHTILVERWTWIRCVGRISGASLYLEVDIDGPCVEATQMRNTQIGISSD
jgi:hypothetical protein